MKKSAAPFLGYSEREWGAMVAVVMRVCSSVDTVRLRHWLEQLGRDYVTMLLASLDPELLKFFGAKEELAAKFRREVIEAGQLPPELQQGAAEWVGEIERYYQDRKAELDQLGPSVAIQSIEVTPDHWRITNMAARPQSAHLAAVDSYYESLLYTWIGIVGATLQEAWNTKACRPFIAACARPVVGPKSTSERAIGDRLYRMQRRRRRMDQAGA